MNARKIRFTISEEVCTFSGTDNGNYLQFTLLCGRIDVTGGKRKMIVYYKLKKILEEKGMNWQSLLDAGLSANMPYKFSQNKGVNTDTIDKVCAYLQVQPGDIMEWVDEKSIQEAKLQSEIEILQAKLAELQKKKENL